MTDTSSMSHSDMLYRTSSIPPTRTISGPWPSLKATTPPLLKSNLITSTHNYNLYNSQLHPGRFLPEPPPDTGHNRGRSRGSKGAKRGLFQFEVLRAWGVSLPALCAVVIPFRAGPRKTCPPMDPPAKEPVPHRRTTRARAPNTPRISVLEERATLVVGRRGWPCPHNHHHIAPPPPDIIHITLEIGSGRAGARDNVGGAYGGPSTGRPWRRMIDKPNL